MLVVLLALLVSGCAGFRLYSDARDKQGQAASKAWSEVDLKAYFQAARTQRKQLIDQEIATTGERVLAQRDSTIRAIVDLPLNAKDGEAKGLFARIEGDLAATLGPPPEAPAGSVSSANPSKKGPPPAATAKSVKAQLDAWQSSRDALAKHIGEQQFDLGVLELLGVPSQSCGVLGGAAFEEWKKKASEKAVVSAEARLDSLKDNCEQQVEDEKAINKLASSFGGALGTAWTRMLEVEKQIAVATQRAKQQEAVYRKAQGEYDKALQAARAAKDQPAASAELRTAASKLTKAFDALAALQDAVSAELVAKERLDKIDALLADVQASKDPAADATRTEVVVLLLPKILDDAQAIERVRTTVTKPSLLIRRDLESARWGLAKMEVQSQQKVLEIERALFESQAQEAILIQRASDALQPVRGTTLASLPFGEAVSKSTQPAQKVALYDGAGRYIDAIGRQRLTTETLRVQRSSLGYERSLAYSENSASQWDSLIAGVVGQAAEFGAGGQKIDNYKDIIQTLVFLWIGHGVNN
jgi:hypothetical protein